MLVDIPLNRANSIVAVVLGLTLFGIVGGALPQQVAAEESALGVTDNRSPQRGMWSEQPAQRWPDALITGNGTLGAMVMGGPAYERIILNHERLYEPLLDAPCPVPDIASALPEIRRLLLSGKYQEAYDYSIQAAMDAGFPGIQWTDPYHPACAMTLEQEFAGKPNDYWRSTDFNTGEIAVHWRDQQRRYLRQTFASRTDGVIVQRFSASGDANVRGLIRLVNQDSRPADERVTGNGGGYHDPVIEAKENWLTYQCKYHRTQRGYQVVLRVVAEPGAVHAVDGALQFDAPEVMVFIAINSLENFADAPTTLEETKRKLVAIDAEYPALLERHAKVHGEMMGRVAFHLADDKDPNLSSEALIALQKETASETLQPTLLEKMFDMGRYSLISSSGQWPPNLMGIWNGDWRPAWSGDFTLDANVNLQIAAANLGNLPEAVESYTRLFVELVPDWQTNAKNLHGCRGVLAGTRTDGRHNLHTHFSPTFPGHFWTAGAQWLALPMWEHYQTAGDEAYLNEQLLPLMKQIATFFVDFLQVRDDAGNRVFVPSYSPENSPSNTRCPAAINATMDIACAKEALTNLIDVCESHDINDPDLANWKRLRDELPPYLLTPEGALKEWAYPDLQDNNDHRHVSHLYPVWPGHEINPEETPDLFEAAKVAAHDRGRGNGSAHGLAHMALIGARLKEAELVYGNLRFMLSNDYLLTSLFTFHNPGRIYNADMLHSLPAVVMEMLVYSKPGEIELLPALSKQLTQGEIRGICCRNATVVENLQWDLSAGEVRVTLRSKIDQPMKLRLRAGIDGAEDSHGKTYAASEAGVLTLDLKAGEPLSLTLRLATP